MVVKELLDNGLTLVTEAMPHVRSAAVGVWLRRGSRHEPPAQAGISHFIEHMVFKGTRTRSAEEIAAQVDSIGGHMDAFTAKEYASFHLKVLDEHLPLAIELLADIVLHPLFDPAEMTKEKRVIFEEFSMVEDTPDDLVIELFTKAFWPDHPLGRPILGTKPIVQSFTRADLLAFFRKVYTPGNILIAAAGHFEHAAVASLVREQFGGLEPGRNGSDGSPPLPAMRRLTTRSKKELEQVHLCLGTPGYHQGHTDRYVLYVVNAVLGGSLSSRLFQNIREKRGLVYSISSGVTAYSDAGAVTVYAGTGLDKAAEVVRLSVDEMKRLVDDPIPAAELRRAKDHLKGSLMLSLESTGSRMSHIARQELYYGRQYGLDETLAAIEAVSAEDAQRVAADVFGGGLTMSLLGNLKGYRPKASLLRL